MDLAFSVPLACVTGFESVPLVAEGDNPDKIRLRDIEALSLYQNRMTNARRVSAVPQVFSSSRPHFVS